MTEFQDVLRTRMHQFVAQIYRLSTTPSNIEIPELKSTLRASALNMILQYIDAVSRQREEVKKDNLEKSFGLLKEAKYLLYLLFTQQEIPHHEYTALERLSDEIGKLLCAEMESVGVLV